MNNILEKAVLPVAGLGTRLFPLTNLLPKAMLPIYNKPALQYVVEEAMRIDIENFLFVTNDKEASIKNYFDLFLNVATEVGNDKNITNKEIFNQSLLAQAAFSYVHQPLPLGLGNALSYAETFVGASPFLVLLADDLIAENSSFILKFKKCFENFKAPIIAVKRVPYEEISSYGIIEGPEIKNNVFEITKMYEKPALSEARSNLAIVGRYILTPDIFDYLKVETPGVGGEIQLTGALQAMLKEKKMYAMLVEEERFDIGTWEGWFLANVVFCLKNSKEKNKLIASLEKAIKRG